MPVIAAAAIPILALAWPGATKRVGAGVRAIVSWIGTGSMIVQGNVTLCATVFVVCAREIVGVRGIGREGVREW